MLTADTLLKVITPETIENIGNDKISIIKKLGKENSYMFFDDVTIHPNFYTKGIEQKNQKLIALSNGRLAANFSQQEKILFCSELRFPSDNKIIAILKNKKITPDDIKELDELIKNFQQEQIKLTLETIKLEEKYSLKVGQVIDIIKLYPSLLNSNFELSEIDSELYKKAKKFYFLLKFLTDTKEKKLKEVNKNETFAKLVTLTKEYFGHLPQDVYLLINKVNELLVTNPEYTISNKQKKLQ